MKQHKNTFKFGFSLIFLLFISLGCTSEWSHYYSSEGEFSMDTPETPIEVIKFADMAIGPVTVYSTSYTEKQNQLAYAVNYYELSEDIIAKDDKTILALAASSFISFSGKNVNVLKKKDIIFDGINGIELELESSRGSRLVKGKVFYTHKKVYYVVMEKIGDKVITKADEKFLNSFKFHFNK